MSFFLLCLQLSFIIVTVLKFDSNDSYVQGSGRGKLTLEVLMFSLNFNER